MRLVSSRYSAPALDKGLDILEALAAETDGLTLTNLAAKVDRKTSEVFRVVDVLKRRGYVKVDRTSDRLCLTLKIYSLAHTQTRFSRLLRDARPVMEDLARRSGQSCHLAIHDNGRMLVISQVNGPRTMGFSVRIGAQVEILKSASGRAFLAFQDERSVKTILGLAGFTQMPGPRQLRVIQKVRQDGFDLSESDLIRGVTNMSFPVMGPEGVAMAALTVPYIGWVGNETGPSIDEVRAMLGSAAKELSGAVRDSED